AGMAAATGAGAFHDLCCGQGRLTAMLAAHGSVTGIDFSPVMLARAAETAPGATLVEGDIRALPLADASVACATCNHGLMHVADRGAALAEIARVLRPGARLLFSNWSPPEENPVFATVFGAVKANLAAPPPPAPDLFELARPATADPLIAAAGLTLVSRETMTLPWTLDAAEDLFRTFAEGTIGLRMMIAAQPPESTASMAAMAAETVRTRFAREGGDGPPFAVPVTIAVSAVEKPA
ncbi:MAG: class I SAM-dependent methyltransferase, partial [Pseudomonadota bacterium]